MKYEYYIISKVENTSLRMTRESEGSSSHSQSLYYNREVLLTLVLGNTSRLLETLSTTPHALVCQNCLWCLKE